MLAQIVLCEAAPQLALPLSLVPNLCTIAPSWTLPFILLIGAFQLVYSLPSFWSHFCQGT